MRHNMKSNEREENPQNEVSDFIKRSMKFYSKF